MNPSVLWDPALAPEADYPGKPARSAAFLSGGTRAPATGPTESAESPTPLPTRTDCAVIGAGITGLCAALTLADLGVEVVVLEARTCGSGASSRNAGMALTGLKVPLGQMIDEHGRELAHSLYRASVESVEVVERLVHDETIDCGFVRGGHLAAACKPAHLEVLRQKQAILAEELDYQTVLVEPHDLPGELRTTYYHGGLVDPLSAGLDPGRYTGGLAAAVGRRGVTIHEHTPALSLASIPGGFAVGTPRGTVRADHVLMATNAYTGALHPGLRRRIVPIGSHVIATAPLGERRAASLIPRDRMVFDTKNMLFYFRRSPDHRIVFGGRASFTPTSPSRAGESLRRGMIDVFPDLAGVDVEHAWGGLVGFTFDRQPHLGEIDGVHYAMGYCGHGVALASYLGQKIARIIAQRSDDTPFRALRFPISVAYRGRPWFLPLAGAYYRSLDAVR